MLDKEITTEKKKIGFGLLTVVTIVTVLVVIAGIFLVVRMVGKANLQATVSGTEKTDIGDAQEGELEENQILYNGQVYELNKDLKPIRHHYLASEAEVRAKMAAVAAQGKAKH